jgi:hypothetical protein
MTTLTANTSKPQSDRAAGQFDAVVGLSPVTTELNSQYFQAYLKAVVTTGSTPF